MAECQDWVASHLPVAWIHLHSLDTTFFRLKVNQGILVSILCVVYSPVIYIYIFTGWWFQPLWKILIKWDIVPKIWKNIKCSKAPTSHKWRFLNWGYHKIIQNQTIHFVLKPMVTLGSPISKPPKFWKQSCTWPPANHEYSVFCILNIHVWFFSANHWHALTTVPLINPFVSHS